MAISLAVRSRFGEVTELYLLQLVILKRSSGPAYISNYNIPSLLANSNFQLNAQIVHPRSIFMLSSQMINVDTLYLQTRKRMFLFILGMFLLYFIPHIPHLFLMYLMIVKVLWSTGISLRTDVNHKVWGPNPYLITGTPQHARH